MRDFGKVYMSYWTSTTIRAMSEDGRTLAMYLLTCPHGTIAGVFRLPDGYACEDLQWDSERVRKGFAELLQNGFANRCETTKWVWIAKHLEWNPPENPNQKKAAAKVALMIPGDCVWKLDFIDKNGDSLGIKAEPFFNPSGTLSKPVVVAVAVAVDKTLSTTDVVLVASKAADPSGKKFDNEPQTPTPNVAEPERIAEPESETDTEPETTLPNDHPPIPPCPHERILRLFGDVLPALPQPRIWDGQRRHNLQQRWKWLMTTKKPNGDRHATDTESGLAWLERFFRYVAESDFLTGRSGSWSADLGWLVKSENFSKVVSGNYENREAA